MNNTGDTAFVVLEGVANLVAKSLVTLDPTVPGGRWMLLETIRAYAFEKLVESGEAEAGRRTSDTTRCSTAISSSRVGGSRSRLSPIEDVVRYAGEIDNVRAALDWACSPLGDPAIGVILAAIYVLICLHSSLVP